MRIRQIVPAGETTVGYGFRCPGCATDPTNSGFHVIYTAPYCGRPVWGFNGSTEKPTFTPSLLTHVYGLDDPRKCHIFVTDGKIQYLSDCYHKLAGQTVEMIDFDQPRST